MIFPCLNEHIQFYGKGMRFLEFCLPFSVVYPDGFSSSSCWHRTGHTDHIGWMGDGNVGI